MIEMPKRSVTRFFIPLIDVLTLMFCIYLLMPMVAPSDAAGDAPAQPEAKDGPLSAADRKELEQLRLEKKHWKNLRDYTKQKEDMLEELSRLRKEKLETLQKRIAIQVLEIGPKGRLYFYDAQRLLNKRVEITSDNVGAFVRGQEKQAGDKELYLLILYPRVVDGISAYPLKAQRDLYERWFQNVPHSYDVPVRAF